MTCPLCEETSTVADPPTSPTFHMHCRGCGEYRVTHSALDVLGNDRALGFALATWVYDQNLAGLTPLIDSNFVEKMRRMPPVSVEKRAERYLGALIRRLSPKLTGRVSLADKLLLVASGSRETTDSVALAYYLEGLGAVERPTTGGGQEILLTAKGHIIYAQMTTQRARGSQVFVASWFAPELTTAFEDGIAPAVSGSGYSPLRIDRKEHSQKIDDVIIAEIRRSAFVIADFTGHRGGVYYEAGFAHGLGLTVIFMCREDALDQLHFDVRQYNTIQWKTPTDIVRPLRNRILSLFGPGPLAPDAKPIA